MYSLASHADSASYKAKSGHTRVAIYVAEDDVDSLQRLTLLGDLRNAIDNGELELFYQPKLSLISHRITGVEALARWTHPQLGSIAPDKFIAIAERNGLMRDLTAWALREAISTCAKWQRNGLNVSIAVNLSPLNLIEQDLPLRLAQWLEDAAVSPERIELELTETGAMSDLAHATEIFERLAAMGVRLAIDDFGTGMSSLAYLKRLPVQDIKIDRGFVTDMLQDENNAVLVRSIIDLAHNLGRVVIAEGIEDKETLQALQNHGCDAAQGYYIGRPVCAEQVEPILRAGVIGLGLAQSYTNVNQAAA